MHRSIVPEDASAGFTLIEVVVALSIVAIGLSSIGMLMASSVRGTRSIESRLARLETARAIVNALPDRDQLQGELSGEIAGYPWRVAVSPFAIAAGPQTPVAWSPQTIVVTVKSPNGGTTQISTVRLQRRDGK